MTDVQIGRILRALRLRRRVRQADVGSAGGVSQSTISLIERGHLDRLSLDTLRRVFAVLDARLEATVTWRGAAIDTLLDEEHARIVRLAVERLVRLGWETAVEVTYARYGERGSIDVLAGKRSEGAVVVVEVKSVIGGLEETGASSTKRAASLQALPNSDLAGGPAWLVVSSFFPRPRRHVGRRDGTPSSSMHSCPAAVRV